jgi:hypothetical protein
MVGWEWSEEDEYMRSPPKQTPYGAAHSFWNPLTDDGDALRLAVKLGMQIRYPYKGGVTAHSDFPNFMTTPPVETLRDDPYAATRRAIVRAAAEIGRGKE